MIYKHKPFYSQTTKIFLSFPISVTGLDIMLVAILFDQVSDKTFCGYCLRAYWQLALPPLPAQPASSNGGGCADSGGGGAGINTGGAEAETEGFP